MNGLNNINLGDLLDPHLRSTAIQETVRIAYIEKTPQDNNEQTTVEDTSEVVVDNNAMAADLDSDGPMDANNDDMVLNTVDPTKESKGCSAKVPYGLNVDPKYGEVLD